MLWAVPVEQHWREKPTVVFERYAAFADVVVQVAFDPDVVPIEGDRLFTAILLASVASFESFYRRDIMNCEAPGLGGALGPFQHESPRARERVCGSWEQATRHALGMLQEGWVACKKLDLRDRVSFYTDGRCERDWWRSRSRVMRAQKYLRALPYDVFSGHAWQV
jgi:hypothetical protein